MCIPQTVSIMETKICISFIHTMEEAEIFLDECIDKAFIMKVENNEEIFIKEKNID